MNAVRRLRKEKVGNRLDEIVPHLARDRLDLVEIRSPKPVERRPQPVLECASIAGPSRERAADQHVDFDFALGGQLERPEQDRLVRAGRLAFDFAAIVERQRKLDRCIARQLLGGVRMAAVDRQDRPVAVVPAKTDIAHAAVDLGLHVNREDRPGKLSAPVVLDPEPLDVLAR